MPVDLTLFIFGFLNLLENHFTIQNSENPEKIHSGTNFEKFGDGFFSIWNSFPHTSKLEITTSNVDDRFDKSKHRNTILIDAQVGIFQCFQVFCVRFQSLTFVKI